MNSTQINRPQKQVCDAPSDSTAAGGVRISLLTGADDRSYALGLATSLMERGIFFDFIGSDEVDDPALHGTPLVRFLNLRGDQSRHASFARKVARVLAYYLRLIAYAVSTRAQVFHILWNNKFEHVDRTALMFFYRLCGRRVVLTAHNVNAAKRDGRDSVLNRFTLSVQYRLCDHVFVHSQRMREELHNDFKVPTNRISVIPFGINNTTPTTDIDAAGARQLLGLSATDRVLLFFGQIAPYKGLEHLVAALPSCAVDDPNVRLVIAGKVKAGCDDYWLGIKAALADPMISAKVMQRIEHIPDADVELYFKAADVLVVPYMHIFQSGVPFLAYSFGLPVIATDVGALRDDVIEGLTGLICRRGDPEDLSRAIADFFGSAMYRGGSTTRRQIREHANERHSWASVASITEAVYRMVMPSD